MANKPLSFSFLFGAVLSVCVAVNFPAASAYDDISTGEAGFSEGDSGAADGQFFVNKGFINSANIPITAANSIAPTWYNPTPMLLTSGALYSPTKSGYAPTTSMVMLTPMSYEWKTATGQEMGATQVRMSYNLVGESEFVGGGQAISLPGGSKIATGMYVDQANNVNIPINNIAVQNLAYINTELAKAGMGKGQPLPAWYGEGQAAKPGVYGFTQYAAAPGTGVFYLSAPGEHYSVSFPNGAFMRPGDTAYGSGKDYIQGVGATPEAQARRVEPGNEARGYQVMVSPVGDLALNYGRITGFVQSMPSANNYAGTAKVSGGGFETRGTNKLVSVGSTTVAFDVKTPELSGQLDGVKVTTSALQGSATFKGEDGKAFEQKEGSASGSYSVAYDTGANKVDQSKAGSFTQSGGALTGKGVVTGVTSPYGLTTDIVNSESHAGMAFTAKGQVAVPALKAGPGQGSTDKVVSNPTDLTLSSSVVVKGANNVPVQAVNLAEGTFPLLIGKDQGGKAALDLSGSTNLMYGPGAQWKKVGEVRDGDVVDSRTTYRNGVGYSGLLAYQLGGQGNGATSLTLVGNTQPKATLEFGDAGKVQSVGNSKQQGAGELTVTYMDTPASKQFQAKPGADAESGGGSVTMSFDKVAQYREQNAEGKWEVPKGTVYFGPSLQMEEKVGIYAEVNGGAREFYPTSYQSRDASVTSSYRVTGGKVNIQGKEYDVADGKVKFGDALLPVRQGKAADGSTAAFVDVKTSQYLHYGVKDLPVVPADLLQQDKGVAQAGAAESVEISLGKAHTYTARQQDRGVAHFQGTDTIVSYGLEGGAPFISPVTKAANLNWAKAEADQAEAKNALVPLAPYKVTYNDRGEQKIEQGARFKDGNGVLYVVDKDGKFQIQSGTTISTNSIPLENGVELLPHNNPGNKDGGYKVFWKDGKSTIESGTKFQGSNGLDYVVGEDGKFKVVGGTISSSESFELAGGKVKLTPEKSYLITYDAEGKPSFEVGVNFKGSDGLQYRSNAKGSFDIVGGSEVVNRPLSLENDKVTPLSPYKVTYTEKGGSIIEPGTQFKGESGVIYVVDKDGKFKYQGGSMLSTNSIPLDGGVELLPYNNPENKDGAYRVYWKDGKSTVEPGTKFQGSNGLDYVAGDDGRFKVVGGTISSKEAIELSGGKVKLIPEAAYLITYDANGKPSFEVGVNFKGSDGLQYKSNAKGSFDIVGGSEIVNRPMNLENDKVTPLTPYKVTYTEKGGTIIEPGTQFKGESGVIYQVDKDGKFKYQGGSMLSTNSIPLDGGIELLPYNSPDNTNGAYRVYWKDGKSTVEPGTKFQGSNGLDYVAGDDGRFKVVGGTVRSSEAIELSGGKVKLTPDAPYMITYDAGGKPSFEVGVKFSGSDGLLYRSNAKGSFDIIGGRAVIDTPIYMK